MLIISSPLLTHLMLNYSFITQRESKASHLQHIHRTDKVKCHHHHEAPPPKKSVLTRCQKHLTGEKHVSPSQQLAERKSVAADELVRNALLIFPLGRLSASESTRGASVPGRFRLSSAAHSSFGGGVGVLNLNHRLPQGSNAAVDGVCMKLTAEFYIRTHRNAHARTCTQCWPSLRSVCLSFLCRLSVTSR